MKQDLNNRLKSVLYDDGVVVDKNKILELLVDLKNKISGYPFCILVPKTVEQLSYIVQIISSYKIPLLVRGAGISSSGGLSIDSLDYVMIDLRSLNQIEEINQEDMYITVQAGCSWEKLFNELDTLGFKTTCSGYGDGIVGTVGGSVSDNELLSGYSYYGTLSNNILGMDVILADGSILETGSSAADGRIPFSREFGPDLTGLFIGDSGSLGIKARVTLKIVHKKNIKKYFSFAFERIEDLVLAQTEISKNNIKLEHWGVDIFNNSKFFRQTIKRPEQSRNNSLFLASSSPKGLIDGVRLSSKTYYYLNIMIECSTKEEAQRIYSELLRLCQPYMANEIENSLKNNFDKIPFAPLGIEDKYLSSNYTNSLFPVSRALEISAITDEYFIRHSKIIEKNDLLFSYLTSSFNSSFFIEARIWWPSSNNSKGTDEDIVQVVNMLLRDLAGLWDTFGASRCEIGRVYNFENQLSSAASSTLKVIKSSLDPNFILNPGVLGLNSGYDNNTKNTMYPEFPQDLLRNSDDVL